MSELLYVAAVSPLQKIKFPEGFNLSRKINSSVSS